jgi:hypothetical protein
MVRGVSGDAAVGVDIEDGGDAVDTARAAHEGARGLGVETFTQPLDLCGSDDRLKLCFAAQVFGATPSAGLPAVTDACVRGAGATVSCASEWTDSNEPLVYVSQCSVDCGATFSDLSGKAFSAELGEEAEACVPLPCGERVAFATYVNNVVGGEPSVRHLVPLDVYSSDLVDRMSDGLLLGALLNVAPKQDGSGAPRELVVSEGLLSPEAASSEEKLRNVRAALAAGVEGGYPLSEVQAEAVVSGDEGAVLDLVWKVIHKQLVSPIRTEGRPELKALRRKHEDFDSWLCLAPEEVVRRWASFHNGWRPLEESSSDAEVDFTSAAVRVLSLGC